MNNSITFDTHEFVKKLEGVGFSEEQAELITDLQRTAVFNTLEQAKRDYELDKLITTRDLDNRIKEAEFKMEQIKNELIRWLISAGIVQTILIIGLLLK